MNITWTCGLSKLAPMLMLEKVVEVNCHSFFISGSSIAHRKTYVWTPPIDVSGGYSCKSQPVSQSETESNLSSAVLFFYSFHLEKYVWQISVIRNGGSWYQMAMLTCRTSPIRPLTFLFVLVRTTQPRVFWVLQKLWDMLASRDASSIYNSLCRQSNPCIMPIFALSQVSFT